MPAQKKFYKLSPKRRTNNWRNKICCTPPVADLLKNVESRYLLVNVVAQRARQIATEAEALQEELTEKPVTLAIREVAEGKLTASLKEEYRH